MKNNIFTDALRFFTNRIFILTLVIGFLFYLLIAKLFELQIVDGEYYLNELQTRIAREISITPQRGSIYDAYGRPLAVNQFVYNLKIDPSISVTEVDFNTMIYNMIKLLEANGESFVDDLPISLYEPFEFTYTGETSASREQRWKQDMDIDPTLTADESIQALRNKFNLGEGSPFEHISNLEARNIISIRSKLYTTRFFGYNLVTVAQNVGLDTITIIEEDAERFKALTVDTEALRYYPQGMYMSHIVGYMGNITAESNDIDALTERGYNIAEDKIGRSGLELYFEQNLRGLNGKETVIVNATGRRVGTLDDTREDPVHGDRVFITVDSKLQQEAYDIMEEVLTDIIIRRLRDVTSSGISAKDLLASLVGANNLSARDIFESEEGSSSHRLKTYVLSVEENADASTREGRLAINKILSEGISQGRITPTEIILTMHEQGIITADEAYLARIRSGNLNATQVLIDKLSEGEITPQMCNIDPSSASLIVIDVKTGAVIAAPTYPTYDNNDYITNFNQTYFQLYDDPTLPTLNRPFEERRAPGSTFKMISAIAALEYGVITPTTTVYDEVTFRKAGQPFLRCWSTVSHGNINVSQALAVSCNYFFADVIYRIGNARTEEPLLGIETLNRYMRAFELDQKSGVEIRESFGAFSSPAYKEMAFANLDETSAWLDGNTAASAIGQGFSAYTPAIMVKYIGALATRGEINDLHFLDRIVSEDSITEYVATPRDMGLDISESTWNAVFRGMLEVTQGRQGTARNFFNDFPIQIASKTGTAEEFQNRADHTSFAAFAPYDDPQIAIYVSIPFSNISNVPSPATQVGRKVLDAYFKINTEPERPLEENSIVK